jgi:hypothetical protein
MDMIKTKRNNVSVASCFTKFGRLMRSILKIPFVSRVPGGTFSIAPIPHITLLIMIPWHVGCGHLGKQNSSRP